MPVYNNKMVQYNYSLLEFYQWHGTFYFETQDKKGKASGLLNYDPTEGPSAEILFEEHYNWLNFSNSLSGTFEKHEVIYATLVDKEKNSVCYATLINCSLRCVQMGSAPPRYVVYPAYVLFSNSSRLELTGEKLLEIDAKFNTWPEFNFPQNIKNKKKFETDKSYIRIQNKLSVSFKEDVRGYPIRNFSAYEGFIGPDEYLNKITNAIQPIIDQANKNAQSHQEYVYLKSTDTHSWYLRFKKPQAEANNLKEYVNTSVEFSYLLMLLELMIGKRL